MSANLNETVPIILALLLAAVVGAIIGVLYARFTSRRQLPPGDRVDARPGPRTDVGGRPSRFVEDAPAYQNTARASAAPAPGWGRYAVERRKHRRVFSSPPPAPPQPPPPSVPVFEDPEPFDDQDFQPTRTVTFLEAMEQRLPMGPLDGEPDRPAIPLLPGITPRPASPPAIEAILEPETDTMPDRDPHRARGAAQDAVLDVVPVPAPVPAPVHAPIPAPIVARVPAPIPAPIPSPIAAPVPSPIAAPVPAPIVARASRLFARSAPPVTADPGSDETPGLRPTRIEPYRPDLPLPIRATLTELPSTPPRSDDSGPPTQTRGRLIRERPDDGDPEDDPRLRRSGRGRPLPSPATLETRPPLRSMPAQEPPPAVLEPAAPEPESAALEPAEPGPMLADPVLPPLEPAEVEWRDVDAHLRIRLRPAAAATAGLDASAPWRTLHVVGIGVEGGERVILASEGPLCATEAIALSQIEGGIDLDTDQQIDDLWVWLKRRDPFAPPPLLRPASPPPT